MKKSDRKPGAIHVEAEIEADRDRVWQAISDAEQLRRWFPLDAEVEPGEGGSVTLSWGPGCSGTARIQRWRPGERLTWIEEWPGETETRQVAVDFTIETAAGGRTLLRLVNSGFSSDDDWAEYLDVLDSGWRYFLFNLKHYLERHWGRPRRMVWDRRKVILPRAEVWDRLFGRTGLVSSASAPLSVDGKASLWDGSTVEVALVVPSVHFAAKVPALNEALFFLELEPGGESFHLGSWLSLYGVAPEQAASLQNSLRGRLDHLFG